MHPRHIYQRSFHLKDKCFAHLSWSWQNIIQIEPWTNIKDIHNPTSLFETFSCGSFTILTYLIKISTNEQFWKSSNKTSSNQLLELFWFKLWNWKEGHKSVPTDNWSIWIDKWSIWIKRWTFIFSASNISGHVPFNLCKMSDFKKCSETV